MKPSEFDIFLSVESYDETTAENCRNCYATEKRIVSKLLRYRFQIFKAQIEVMNKNCVQNLRSYHLYFPRNKPSKSVTIGRGWVELCRTGGAGSSF